MASDFFVFSIPFVLKESNLKRSLKKIEIAARRGFIASLQFSSRFKKESSAPLLPLELPEDPTILFLRQDRLGDAIVSTPLLIELYKKYPKAHFIMLLGENNKGIADLLPIPCEVVVYQKQPLKDIAMLRKLRKRKIDVLIDLMDNPSSTSSILMAAISPKYCIGIDKANSSSYNIRVPLIDRATFHIARRLAELLRPFGIDPESISLQPRLKQIEQVAISGRVGLVVSAGAVNRYVPNAITAEIADQIFSKGLVTEVIILFHPKDRKIAEDIISRTHDSHIMLGNATENFTEYAMQLRSCEFVISPDTSALHLCSAYGIPVVGIYAPFPPELHYWTPIGVPYEMIIGAPSLESLEAKNVVEHFEKLIHEVKHHEQETVISA